MEISQEEISKALEAARMAEIQEAQDQHEPIASMEPKELITGGIYYALNVEKYYVVGQLDSSYVLINVCNGKRYATENTKEQLLKTCGRNLRYVGNLTLPHLEKIFGRPPKE